MRCIIVDDEPLIRELIEDNLRQIPYIEHVASCKNAKDALKILQEEKIDLIFLDIQMPGLTGLQLLQSLDHPPMVIMITAFEHHAVEAFDLQVVDYVVKPFRFERLLKACNRAAELFRMKNQTVNEKKFEKDHFFVPVEYSLVKIVIGDIEYIEGLKDYIKIHLSSSSKPVVTRMSIKSLEEKLPPQAFIRTHKSYLVAASRITRVKRDMVCLGTLEIPIGDMYRENVEKMIKG
jgi:Response regulator of the LytR/AlgR family